MEKHLVLIIDDDHDFVDAVKIVLENHNFSVLTAFDGEEGLRLTEKWIPDIVILDVMMPKKDGYSVCHDIKSKRLTSHIPVLMLTSLGDKGEGKYGAEIMAKGHKAEAYLDKPVDPESLVKKSLELIQKAKAIVKEASKVLLIDDDPDFIAALKAILEENGYQVIVAYTGEDGLTLAQQEMPDLILLDVMLPGKDGFAVCKELKEVDKTRSLPVFMLTSVGQKLTEPGYAKAVAVTHHADEYIEKPVDNRELLKKIRDHIGPRHRLI